MKSIQPKTLKHPYFQRVLLGLLLFLQTLLLFSQSFELIKSVNVDPISTLTADRFGNLYIGFQNGPIQQMDSLARPLFTYYPEFVAEPSVIETGLAVRVMVFYQDVQRIVWLTRRMMPIEETEISALSYQNPDFGLTATVATAADGAVWAWNSQQRTLKKIWLNNQQAGQVVPLDLQLPQNSKVLHLHEHNHFLWLGLEQQGVWIFSDKGERIKAVNFPLQSDFQVWGDFLAARQKGEIVLKNWKDATEEIRFSLPIPNAEVAYLSDRFLYLYGRGKLHIFRWNLEKSLLGNNK